MALEQATFEDIKFQQLCNDCPGMRAVLVGGANGRRDADGIGLRLVSSPRWLHRSLAKAGAVGVAVTSPNLVAEMLRQSKKKLSSELACHLLRLRAATRGQLDVNHVRTDRGHVFDDQVPTFGLEVQP